MRLRWICALVALVSVVRTASAQYESPADVLTISAGSAQTWVEGDANAVVLDGGVKLTLDQNEMTARQAVVWISQLPRSQANLQRVEVALIGDAVLRQPGDIVRSGPRLFIDAKLRGPVRLETERRIGGDATETDTYKLAKQMRPVLVRGGEGTGRWLIEDQPFPATQPATRPTDRARQLRPVALSANHFGITKSPEGKEVAVLSGKVALLQRTEEGELLELFADRVVVFTPYDSLAHLTEADKIKQVEEAVTGVYLEGDVRINRTPAAGDRKNAEQRLAANRAFYDFTTDRAVLTDVVLHTVDPTSQIPVVMRARMVRQLSQREYTAENSSISSSSFHTPSYSIGARTTYMRQTEVGNEITGTRTNFVVRDATLDMYGVPIFYTPAMAGTLTERGWLRNIEVSNSRAFGFGVSTEWGLFETLGKTPPRGTDLSYKVDYFTDRGPAFGLDGKYAGNSIDDTTLDPWSYAGDFTSYIAFDHGVDDLGRRRVDVEPEDDVRGRFYWRHQHFFPDNWQVQVTGGYISDPTFLEEWFNRDFRNSAPLDTSIYAKYQDEGDAFTFLTSVQPSDFATTAEVYQEQAEIERFAEVGYRRIGDSFSNDQFTFFSSNVVSALRHDPSDYSLEELGFRPATVGRFSPGLPSWGQTGLEDDVNYRGDFRQEVNWPFSLSRFRVVPFVLGRYTAYTESVDGGSIDRLYAGAGMRMTTAFWRIDDSAQSRLWDINRMRHVIEPSFNIYAAAQSEDRVDLLIYDEPIDNITDISATQLALSQRWQTKRGGPGRWRNVDFLTLNVEWNYFFDQPPEAELNPSDFRGLFFVTNPESSIPRNSVNVDARWEVSNDVTLMGEVQYNTDESELAVGATQLAVRQDERVSYTVGYRHIGIDFEQVVGGNTFQFEDRDLIYGGLQYQLTTNYRLSLATSYDLAHSRQDRQVLALQRKFDRFYVEVAFRIDNFDKERAVFFNIWPEGMEKGSGTAGNAFGSR